MNDTNAPADSDADIAQQIASVDLMDLPSRHEVIGNPELAYRPITKLTGLAPEHRAEIQAELATCAPDMREEKEAELVQAKVAQIVQGHRLRTGPGEGASEFHKVTWEISREVADLNEQLSSVLLQLVEVAHIDPHTGEQTLRHPHGTSRRAGLEAEMERINHSITLLTGVEGEKRVKAAMDKSIADERARRAERADAVEVEKRAASMVREAELNRRAASRAKFLSPTHVRGQ